MVCVGGMRVGVGVGWWGWWEGSRVAIGMQHVVWGYVWDGVRRPYVV